MDTVGTRRAREGGIAPPRGSSPAPALIAAILLLPAMLASPARGQPDVRDAAAPRGTLAIRATAAPRDTTAMRGQEATAPPLDELIQLAFAHSPSVAALRARLDAARQMARVPGLPNPVLEVMAQDAGFPKWTVGEMEMSMVQVGVTQSFPPLGRIGAQRDAGRADADTRGAELDGVQRQVAAQVRTLYGRLYALDQEGEALRGGSSLLRSLANAAMDRYKANETEQEAVLKAQLSSSRLTERMNDLDAERAGTVAALNRLLDRPGDEPIGRVPSLPEVQVPDSGWAALAVRQSPEVQARRAAVEAAQQRVRLARTGYWPEVMAGGDIGFRGRLDPVVGFRLGVTLPLWETRRTRFEVQAATAELEMAREEQRDTEAMVRSTAARLNAEWRRSEDQVRLYREALIVQSQAALDAAQSSFLADRVDFSTVIEDFQMWLDARAELASREAERFGTWAELEALISRGTATQQEGR